VGFMFLSLRVYQLSRIINPELVFILCVNKNQFPFSTRWNQELLGPRR
jgi:hypothetical protein